MARTYLSTRGKAALVRLLDEQLDTHDGSLCTYKPGCSDATVLAELQKVEPTARINHVGHMRLEAFGRVREAYVAPPAPPPADDLARDLQALGHTVQLLLLEKNKLERRVEVLERQLLRPVTQHNSAFAAPYNGVEQ